MEEHLRWNVNVNAGHKNVYVSENALRWEEVESGNGNVRYCNYGHDYYHRVHVHASVRSGHRVNDHDNALASVATTNESESENGHLM